MKLPFTCVGEHAEIRTRAYRLLWKHGLQDWQVKVGYWFYDAANKRKFVGSCDHERKTIFLSPFHVREHSWRRVRETILHEIAHALCRPRDGHGLRWQRTARALGVSEAGIRYSSLWQRRERRRLLKEQWRQRERQRDQAETLAIKEAFEAEW